VEGPPPIIGDDPPQDLDGDGLYEDLNGDGEFTIGDVQVFFQNRNSDVVQDNAEFFNFAGNDPPDVSIGDVQALFQLFQDQG
jgi:PKD repeat protein